MMKPDPRVGYWKIELDYDVPLNVALIDVDADGDGQGEIASARSGKVVILKAS